jgi:hypothetical protein
MTNEEFTRLYRVAQAADDAYEAAVQAAGFKSRWDVPRNAKPDAVRQAYDAKVAADASMHDAWEEMRLAQCRPSKPGKASEFFNKHGVWPEQV